MPTYRGSFIGQVVRNTKKYNEFGELSKRYWRWDGTTWQPYQREP